MSTPTNKIDIPIVIRTTYTEPTIPSDVTKQLLESKRPTIGEIEITLFENCNIECDFCFHDKKSTVGLTLEEMMTKVDLAINFMHERQGTVDLMQVNMVGGELLQDRYIDEYCGEDGHFETIARRLATAAEECGYVFKIVWVSNFLFKKRDEVKFLMDRLRDDNIDSHLIVSYDFDGRPMSNRYRENIAWFGPEYICSVNLVGTTTSIHNFMKDEDEYFKWLYATFHTYFDDFIPDKGMDSELPPDSLIYEWYCFIADNYPKINPIRTLIEHEVNEMHCLSLNKLTIFPDNRTSNCRWHRYDQSDFGTKYEPEDNAGMMQNFMDTNGCLSCEYFNRCGFRCYTQWDWKNRSRDMDICNMKAFFNYITRGLKWTKE